MATQIMLVGKVVKTDAECIDFNAGIAIAEMLGRANYIALVGGGKQPKFPQNKVGMVPGVSTIVLVSSH